MFILPLRRIGGTFLGFLQSMWNPPEAILDPKDGVAPIPPKTEDQKRAIDKIAREY